MTYKAHTVDSGTKPFTLFGLTDNINHFLNVTLEPDGDEEPTNVQVSRSGGSRRQYPGDTSRVGFSGSTAVVLRDPSAKDGGNALPGRPVIFESITSFDAEGSPVIDESRQFHLRGNIVDLHAFLIGNAAGPMRLITSRGTRYQINWEQSEGA